MLLPDEGYRYQDTLYNDAWLRSAGLALEALPQEPVAVDRPTPDPPIWTRMPWGRRSLREVDPDARRCESDWLVAPERP